MPVFDRRTYTGASMAIPASNPAYILADDDPAVRAGSEIIEAVTGETADPGVWEFATDGGHFAKAGATPIGFGPGDEYLAHTVDEHLPIDALETALAVNRRLALELGARAAAL